MQRKRQAVYCIQPPGWDELSPPKTSEAQAATLDCKADQLRWIPAQEQDRPTGHMQTSKWGGPNTTPCILCTVSTAVSRPGSPLPHSTHARNHCGHKVLLARCMPGATWLRGKKGWMLGCCGWSQGQGTIFTPFFLLNCGDPWTFLMKILTDSFTGSWKSRGTEKSLISCSFLACVSQTSIYCWSSCHRERD